MSEASGVEVVTLGCRLNIVESDEMRRLATAAGARGTTIVNSCAVTAEAVRQTRQAIRRARRDRPGDRIVVTGCAVETEPGHFAAMSEIDAVLPNRLKTAPGAWQPSGPAAAGSVRPDTHTRGFVEVQNGCDHRCTFCIIPFGRGASRSKPVTEIVGRVAALVEGGAREVVLTGVDVTAYGKDLADEPTLGTLVRRILADVPALPRLRLSSLDCVELDPTLLECLAAEPRLMPHLHLSLQSGSDLILKRMKRRHRRSDVTALCAALRTARPDIAFGADFIVGFPTETEADFAETADLAAACDLAYLHVFPYSARPGTPAARMPPVPGDVIRDRATRLRHVGQTLLGTHLDRSVGRRLTVLSERGGTGHAEDFTRVRLPTETPAGMLLEITAESHDSRVLDAARQHFGNHTP